MARNPSRVEIKGKWFDVKEGWAGTLELSEYMKSPEYTAKEAFAHVDNLFHVFDTNGNKVGEFHTDNNTYSGIVTGIQM